MSKYTAEFVEAEVEVATTQGKHGTAAMFREFAALLRERESAKAVVTELPRYTEWRHLREKGVWSNGVPAWAKDHEGRMNDYRAAVAVIDELAEAVVPMLAKLRKHDFYNAGEVDCPSDIKCSNGELHTLRCRNCGLDNPDGYCSPLNQEKEHPVARVTISESGKFSIQALPGMAIKLRNGQELYSSPMLASARVPDEKEDLDPVRLRREGRVATEWERGFNEGWNDCRETMLTAAPKPETEE